MPFFLKHRRSSVKLKVLKECHNYTLQKLRVQAIALEQNYNKKAPLLLPETFDKQSEYALELHEVLGFFFLGIEIFL